MKQINLNMKLVVSDNTKSFTIYNLVEQFLTGMIDKHIEDFFLAQESVEEISDKKWFGLIHNSDIKVTQDDNIETVPCLKPPLLTG